MSEQKWSLVHASEPARGGDGPHPGFLLLHGRGSDERDLLSLAGELDPRLFTVSARAPFRFPYGGYAWYDLDPRGVGYPGGDTLAQSLSLLDRFIDEILSAYPIRGDRLYVGGFSMGAAMSATLALLFPDRIAGAVVLSGYVPAGAGLPFRLDAVDGHHIFEAHGTRDQVIPVEWGRRSRDYFAGTSVDLTYNEYPMGHEISQRELQDVSSWLTQTLDRSDEPVSPGDVASRAGAELEPR
jgi:phospholipase/carboxylesterase